jgi:DNA mismatch endonuclease, patch repair protein
MPGRAGPHLSRRMSPEVRRRIMSSIRKRDTKPELALRSALWALGVRGWRCHARLPGSPDLAFTSARLAVFVDGVFWHGHPDYLPRGRRGPYWDKKIAGNMERDVRVTQELTARGWTVFRVWDLDVLKDPSAIAQRVHRALAARLQRRGV